MPHWVVKSMKALDMYSPPLSSLRVLSFRSESSRYQPTERPEEIRLESRYLESRTSHNQRGGQEVILQLQVVKGSATVISRPLYQLWLITGALSKRFDSAPELLIAGVPYRDWCLQLWALGFWWSALDVPVMFYIASFTVECKARMERAPPFLSCIIYLSLFYLGFFNSDCIFWTCNF
ncbi:uncharacterized protein HD556DRAFT_1308292 [Suillus plorans]|uniref:Uncharacterized protein n=1 Tax=Suillus plorans TaxID=116603 RepID=A0A9P7ASM1_9AGAM|nr:uncharacterized protein HD556DRAFT_1308292 [Suillus plorans]KAG1794244.1 hypothetical protein HD556DRAFT_1308292 [Suillus plorans]